MTALGALALFFGSLVIERNDNTAKALADVAKIVQGNTVRSSNNQTRLEHFREMIGMHNHE